MIYNQVFALKSLLEKFKSSLLCWSCGQSLGIWSQHLCLMEGSASTGRIRDQMSESLGFWSHDQHWKDLLQALSSGKVRIWSLLALSIYFPIFLSISKKLFFLALDKVWKDWNPCQIIICGPCPWLLFMFCEKKRSRKCGKKNPQRKRDSPSYTVVTTTGPLIGRFPLTACSSDDH